MTRLSRAIILAALLPLPAAAENYPCSGKRGGISHCRGELFVCQDGSTSGSKKDCRSYEGGQYNTDKTDVHPSEKAKTK